LLLAYVRQELAVLLWDVLFHFFEPAATGQALDDDPNLRSV
jgi:hypothetical protein